jgi:hypothetical protein
MSVRKRSSGPKVLGILNLVGGFLGLFLSLIGIVFLLAGGASNFGGANAANDPLSPAAIEAYMDANAPGSRAARYGGTAVDLVLTLLMIVSGFGLLNYRKWARGMAITYAVMSLVVKVAVMTYQFTVVIPTLVPYIDQAVVNEPQPQRDARAIGGKAGAYGGACGPMIFGVYPIVVLSILLSKKGKAAFEPPPASVEDDYEDDYDDRRERFDDRPRRDDDRYGERDDRGRR